MSTRRGTSTATPPLLPVPSPGSAAAQTPWKPSARASCWALAMPAGSAWRSCTATHMLEHEAR
eukprot:6427982-Pyramimonas_sp.AAC.1